MIHNMDDGNGNGCRMWTMNFHTTQLVFEINPLVVGKIYPIERNIGYKLTA